MSNIVYRILNSLGFKLCNSMHACIQARESKGTTIIQAAMQLRIGKKATILDRQKLAGGLRGGVDATGHMRMR